MTRRIGLILTAAFVVILCASSSFAKSEKDDPVTALVSGKEIKKSEIISLHKTHPKLRFVPIDAIYNNLVTHAVDSKLLAMAADKSSIKKDKAFKEQVKAMEEQLLRRLFMEKQIAKKTTDKKLKSLYDDFLKNNPAQEEVRARHVLVDSKDNAKKVLEELKDGKKFEDVAKEYSLDPGTAERGGDLGFFIRRQMVPEFSEAAFALKPGTYTKEPVQSQFGWHVIKSEDRRMQTPPAFAEMRARLAAAYAALAAQEVVEDLREKAEIKMYDMDGKSFEFPKAE